MTLRQFYLLLGDFYFRERLEDIRFYKVICALVKEPPEAAALFPMLRMDPEEQQEEPVDDAAVFQQVTASMTSYTE